MEVGFCTFGAGTSGSLEHDACSLLEHISYASTTLDFPRGLDGVGRDREKHQRAAGWAFQHTLTKCIAMLTLSRLYQRLPHPLPDRVLMTS